MTYIGVDATNGIGEHGVQVGVTMEHEREKIGKRKQGGEKAGLNSAADKPVNDGVRLSETSAGAGEHKGQYTSDQKISAGLEAKPTGNKWHQWREVGHPNTNNKML